MSNEPAAGQIIDKRYRLVEKLGSGAFGAVYLAEQLAYDTAFRSVALKLFLNEIYDVFQAREMLNDALVLTRLVQECPDSEISSLFLQVYDVGSFQVSNKEGESETKGYMAMELMTRDLRSVVGRTGQNGFRVCTVEGALTYLLPVVRALAYMHEQEPVLLHRDLKPGNILIKHGPPTQIKVGDFGLAVPVYKMLGQPQAKGMVRYLDLESLVLHTASPESDVFALGMTAYELLTGHFPFKGDYLEHNPHDQTSRKIMEALAKDELTKNIKPPSHYNRELEREPWLEEIIMDCLKPYRLDRIKDAKALLLRLEHPGENGGGHRTLEERYLALLTQGADYQAKGPVYFEEARNCYQKAIDLSNYYCDGYIKLSGLMLSQGTPQDALCFLDARLREKRCSCVLAQMASIYRSMGNEVLAGYYEDHSRSCTPCNFRLVLRS